MDTLSARHADILARPREDAPREAFAAAVAATDAEAAAFIRAQLDVARRRRAAVRPDREVERAARRCLAPPARHEARWGAPIVAWLSQAPPPHAPVGWGRGFVESATVEARWFLSFGAELRARAPVVDLVVRNLPRGADGFFESFALEGVRSMRFEGPPLTLSQLRSLAASPFLGRLAWLDLAYMQLPAGAPDVLFAPGLAGLQYVRLDGNACPDVNPSVDEEGGATFGERPSAEAARLRAIHGDRPWLRGHPPEHQPLPGAFP